MSTKPRLHRSLLIALTLTGLAACGGQIDTGGGGPPLAFGSNPSYGFSEMVSFTGSGVRLADYADRNVASGTFYIHQNNGNGTWAPSGVNWGTGTSAAGAGWETLIGDFNGDGYADYLDHNLGDGSFYIHLNNQDGTFSSASWGTGKTEAGASWQTVVADFTGDGYADYADHDLVTGAFFVHENYRNGTFSPPGVNRGQGTTAHGAVWEMVAGDFTGDGYADYADHNLATGTFWVHQNYGDGTFAPNGVNWGKGQTAVGAGWEMWVGDFDGDGYADYADHSINDGAFFVHLNRRNGTFSPIGVNWAHGTTAAGPWEILGRPHGAQVWPNAASRANSDPWISAHHRSIVQMRPSVLVLNFVDDATSSRASSLAYQIANGLDVASAYHGYQSPTAAQFFAYNILEVVDLTDDGFSPPGWSHLNSSRYPLKCKSGDGYQFNYSALFNSTFAQYYGFADPSHPGSYLTLTQLVQRGIVNDVWIVVDGNPDPYTCANGVHMSDFQLPEVLEYKQKYDYNDAMMTGSFDPCAGNGCFDADDQPAMRAVGRSLRFLYINSTRGAGCGLHSLGHNIEWMGRGDGPLPRFSNDFLPFANFDLDTRFGAPFRDWYGACGELATCITFTDNNDLSWVDTNGDRGSMSPYDQGCGSVHYPPNARRNYDDQNGFGVLSTCEHYGLHDGPYGQDTPVIYTDAKSGRYSALMPDCQGGWQVYWRQSFPGFANNAWDAEGTPMKSWWPYLYY